MPTNQIVGAIAFVIGVVLLGFAYNASTAPADQITNAITGHYTTQTTWFLLLGIAGVVGGVALGFFGKRSA